MSDFGVELGWYKNKNEENDGGILINVYYLTKKFVKVKTYWYDNNNIDLNNINERDRINIFSADKKLKVSNNSTIDYYKTTILREYNLSIKNKISE
jgi:uncharacterized protein YcfL